MGSNLLLEIALLGFLVLANGYLAMAEIALVSARKERLQGLANKGDKTASLAIELAEDPSNFLSMIQVGITLVGVLAGALGGATVSRQFATWLKQIDGLDRYAEIISISLVVLVITYVNLVFGELVPKRYALVNPERVAILVARLIKWLGRLSTPLVKSLSFSTNTVLRLVGIQLQNISRITEEEIRLLIDQAVEEGTFTSVEQEMVERVFRLADRRISTLITPRSEVEWLDLEDTIDENKEKILNTGHKYFPLIKGNPDIIEGIVSTRKLLNRCLREETLDLLACSDEPLVVPESVPALQALERMRETGHEMVLVIDEFGGFQGVVTLNDILKAIVGDMPAYGQLLEASITQRDDGSWLVDGRVPVDEFMAMIDEPMIRIESAGKFDTVGGFVVEHLGRIPVAGDRFEFQSLIFEIVDMDGLRVDKILVSRISPDEDQTE